MQPDMDLLGLWADLMFDFAEGQNELWKRWQRNGAQLSLQDEQLNHAFNAQNRESVAPTSWNGLNILLQPQR